MSLKSKLILACLGVISLLILYIKACTNDPVPNTTSSVMPTNTVVVQGHNLITNQGTTYVPGPTTITVQNGQINVKAKKFGVSLDPGIGAAFYRDKLLLSTDLRIVYLHRFSLHGALLWSPTEEYVQDIIKPSIFVSYALPYQKFSNTSVFVGATIDQRLIAGIRLGF